MVIDTPLIVDIEASGFGQQSYPIEVGLALEDDHRYCALILPAADWTHWDDSAERVHHISRDILRSYGKPLVEVADQLNQMLAGKTLYSDGWVVDQPWLTTLFFAAGRSMAFHVSPLEAILSEDQMARWHAVKEEVIADLALERHRASNDARIIQETYRRSRRADPRAVGGTH